MKVLKNGNKFILDFMFRDKRFRLTAFETQKHSRRLADTIDRLMEIYHSNDCITLDIQRAIDCMPTRIVRKLERMLTITGKNSEKESVDRPFRRIYRHLKSKAMHR
jgi:hypothetical protein